MVPADALPLSHEELQKAARPDVLRLLVASTTASVIGLFAIVANYLFPRR